MRFLAAGGTLVLTVAPDTFPAMLDAVVARDAADPAFAATVDAAVRTALLAKAQAGLPGLTRDAPEAHPARAGWASGGLTAC